MFDFLSRRRMLTRCPYFIAAELHVLLPVCAALLLAAFALKQTGWALPNAEAVGLGGGIAIVAAAVWVGKLLLRPRFPFREMKDDRRAGGRALVLAGGFAMIAVVGAALYVATASNKELDTFEAAATAWWLGLPVYVVLGRMLFTLTNAGKKALLSGLGLCVTPYLLFGVSGGLFFVWPNFGFLLAILACLFWIGVLLYSVEKDQNFRVNPRKPTFTVGAAYWFCQKIMYAVIALAVSLVLYCIVSILGFYGDHSESGCISGVSEFFEKLLF